MFGDLFGGIFSAHKTLTRIDPEPADRWVHIAPVTAVGMPVICGYRVGDTDRLVQENVTLRITERIPEPHEREAPTFLGAEVPEKFHQLEVFIPADTGWIIGVVT